MIPSMRLNWKFLLLAGLAAAVPATSMGIRRLSALTEGELPNPDGAMRLVRLHDMLHAGAPLHAVMRDGSGAGTVLHWSHLLDGLALLLAAPLAGVLGWDAAPHAVAVLSGPLSLMALGAAVAWAGRPLAVGGAGWSVLAAFMAGAAPMVGSYGMPGVFHHHVLLAVVAVMCWGWALRLVRGEAGGDATGGIALGAWAGAGVWLSPESLPFSLMAFGFVWTAWFAAPQARLARGLASGLAAAAATFLVVVAAAWAVDPPGAGLFAREADRISFPFVALALGTAVPAVAAWCGMARGVVLGAGAVAAGAWWLLAAPPLGGLDALMTREEAAAFFDRITEMEPVRTLSDAMESLLGGLFATGLLAGLAVRRRRRWAEALPVAFAAVCAAVMVALTVQHVRFAAYPTTLGAMLLPGALMALSRAEVPALAGMAGRLALVLTLLMGPFLSPAVAGAAEQAKAAKACPVAGALRLLRPYDGSVVLADVNLSPDLLYGSGVLTVGSLYHRNPAGFMRLRSAWRDVAGDAPGAAFLATRATLVLACPGDAGPLSDGKAGTLAVRLAQGDAPGWLHRVADAGPGGFVLYALER